MFNSKKYELTGVTSYTTYEDDQVKECKVNKKNEIATRYGILIPRHKEPDERKKDTKAMSFYKSGNIKSIFLEEQTEVATPVGVFPAELITFYEDGAIDSLFPLNGQITFGWSEEDEIQLAKTFDFDLPIGQFKVKIIGLRFFESGKLKSLILWPKENIYIKTPLGEFQGRVGFRLYEDGSLESFEPSHPLHLKTPIGEIVAFDQFAVGVDADFNSVRFDRDGNLTCVYTNSDIVINNTSNGQRIIIYQHMRMGFVKDEFIKVPVKVYFNKDSTIIDNGVEAVTFKNNISRFLLLNDNSFQELKCSPGSDCSSCGAACM